MLSPVKHAPLNLPASPRPPKDRTPPELPLPGHTSFLLLEWNFPQRTYLFLKDISLVVTPPPVFITPLAASQQPPQPRDPTLASEPSPGQPLPCPTPDHTPLLNNETIVIATPASPRLGNPPVAAAFDPAFWTFSGRLGLSN